MDLRTVFLLCVLLFVSFVLKAEGRPPIKNGLSVQPNGCSCVKETEDCGCCAHIKFDVLHVKVDDDACVNVTYLPTQYGLSLTFAWNGKIVFNETVSARNPPPFCFGVPHVKVLDVCIRLYNISFDKQHFGGCISLEFEVLHFIKKDFPLGCIYKNKTEAKKYKTQDILKWIVERSMSDVQDFSGELIDDTSFLGINEGEGMDAMGGLSGEMIDSTSNIFGTKGGENLEGMDDTHSPARKMVDGTSGFPGILEGEEKQDGMDTMGGSSGEMIDSTNNILGTKGEGNLEGMDNTHSPAGGMVDGTSGFPGITVGEGKQNGMDTAMGGFSGEIIDGSSDIFDTKEKRSRE